MNKVFKVNIKNKIINELLYYLKILLVVFFIITLFAFPKEIFFATKTGLLLWHDNILPSVFAFIIGINIICASKIRKHYLPFCDNKIAKFIKSFFIKLFNLPFACFNKIFLGLLSGYPLGGRLTSILYDNKNINKKDITRVLFFASACSPMFLISAVGENIFKNKVIGYILILSQVISITIISYIWSKEELKDSFKNLSKDSKLKDTKKNHEIITKDNNNINRLIKNKDEKTVTKSSFPAILSLSITNAIETVLNICGCIVLFCIIIKIIQIYHIDEIMFSFINNISLFIFNYDLSYFKSVFYSLLYGTTEITNGIYYLSTSAYSSSFKILIISFLTTFGGLCVHMQILNAFGDESKIKLINYPKYAQKKIIAGIISAMISYIIIEYYLHFLC